MKVRIVCYEDVNAWILGKFALKMEENLTELGIDVDIAKEADPTADINHHIIYANYNGLKSSNDVLMITHIDDYKKLVKIKKQLDIASIGICMSRDTMNKLVELGVPSFKLTFINPAHDGVIKKKKITIGITCRVQEDGRKREIFVTKLANDIDPELFRFKIMGENWQNQVDCLIANGFEVEYTPAFDYQQYTELIPALDYYLYFGQDEGQMGFIDALYAGVKTIVTPQGYHLDAPNGIVHPYESYQDLLSVFEEITKKIKILTDSIKTWNWLDYSKKHLMVWELILKLNNGEIDQDDYEKKLIALTPLENVKMNNINRFNKKVEEKKLKKEYIRHLFYKIKNKIYE
tara:strand:+ start:5683 stop:6723 length:1041 start_codon:yes stop_codon:yes gene_type:complete